MGILGTLAEGLVERGLLVLGVTVALYAVKFIAEYRRLHHIKGPSFTGFSSWPERIAVLRGTQHLWYEQANKRYGSLARIGPKYVLTSDPELFIHVSNHPDYKRAEWFSNTVRLEYRRDNVFSTSDNKIHNQKRKQVAAGYSGKENEELESVIDGRIRELVSLIRQKYISTEEHAVPVNMAEKRGWPRTKLRHAETDSDVDDYLSSAAAGSRLIPFVYGLGLEWLGQAPIIGKFIIPSEHDNRGFGKNIRLCYKIVRERESREREKPSGRKDMLASFMSHGVAGRDLTSESLVVVLAGLQSTSDSLAAILLQLISSPRVFAKLQREIDEACEDGRVPAAGTGDTISNDVVKQLPYLQAIIREGLRCRPPNCGTFPREVPPGGDTLLVDGQEVYVPGGTSFGVSQLAVQHRKDIFGDDTGAFRPERWFGNDPDKLAAMIRANDLVFGCGRFSCLGQIVAKIEISKAIFEIARHFDISLVHPTRPCTIENIAMGFISVTDMWVMVHERN